MSKVTWKILAIYGLLAVAVLGGCGKSSPSRSQRLTIVYSTNMAGEIRSCGCASHDNGGLGRRATFVAMHRRGTDNFLLLEGGDLFGEGLNYGLEKADLTLQSLRAMNYTGVAVGEEDLLYGVDFLTERAQALNVPLLSANLVDAESGKLVFPPTRIVELPSGMRVGLVAVMDGVKLPEALPADRYHLSSARAAIESHVPRLRKEGKADLVVLLAHAPMQRVRQIARGMTGIDIIMVGHDIRPARQLQRVGPAWVLQASERGRYMGIATGATDEDGRIASLRGGLEPLTTDYEDAESIAKLFMSYDLDIRRQEKATRGVPAGYLKKKYAGAEACAECHDDIYAQWRDTPHAQAFDILIEHGRQYDRDCTPCHTAGFYEMGGFLSVDETPGLIHVQCESCHGNGAEHVSDPDIKTTGDARNICTSCHTTDQSPEFEFDKFWGRIKH